MDNIQIFNNPDFGEIRTIMIGNEPWFVGNDCAKALGFKDPYSGVRKNVDEEDKQTCPVGSGAEMRNMNVINESGLYSLIFGSKLESAKKFKKWVTSEVLPSIRKTGTYGQSQLPDNPMEMLKIHYAALEQVDKKVDTVDSKVNDLNERIKTLEDTTTLDYGQQAVLGQTVNKTVLNYLGGKDAPAYKPIGRRVFAECNSDLKHYFKVNARANVPKKRYEEAVAYAENWKPCTNTVMLINEYNSQNKLDI